MRRLPRRRPRSQLTTDVAAGAVVFDGVAQQFTSTWRIGPDRRNPDRSAARVPARECVVIADRARLGGSTRTGRRRPRRRAARPYAARRDFLLARSTGSMETIIWPDSTRDRSSTSLTSASSARRRSRCAGSARAAPRRRPGRVEAQQLGETEHRVQRGSQLVAHARQELGLGAVGGFERRPRLALGARNMQLGDVAQDHCHQGCRARSPV